jgi:hypothetical protein
MATIDSDAKCVEYMGKFFADDATAGTHPLFFFFQVRGSRWEGRRWTRGHGEATC